MEACGAFATLSMSALLIGQSAWLRFLLNPLILVVVGFYAGFFFYRSLTRSFLPVQRIALSYLFCIAIEHLCIGLMGFTEFNVVAAFAQLVMSPQLFAALNLVRAFLMNPGHPLQNYQYSNWPQTPYQWTWSSITLTIIGAIGIAAAIAVAKRRSIGFRLWFLLSVFFVLASIANGILLFTIGPLYERESFWTLIAIAWSISYASAYWIVRLARP